MKLVRFTVLLDEQNKSSPVLLMLNLKLISRQNLRTFESEQDPIHLLLDKAMNDQIFWRFTIVEHDKRVVDSDLPVLERARFLLPGKE